MNKAIKNFDSINFESAGLFVSRGEWCHPERCISSYEIIFVVAGKVHIREENNEYTLEKNSVLLLSPGKKHGGTRPSRNVSFYWLHFTADTKLCGSHFEFADTAQLVALFRMLLHFINTPFYPVESARYTAKLILNEILFLSEKTADREKAAYIAAEYISSNIRLHPSVSDIAKHTGYNADYLCRVFKKTFGVTLKKYIAEETIKKAKLMLCESGKSITGTALELGFENENLFTKFFKYHEGITPSQYIYMYYNTHINHS
ncbi:MAG: AraC family transcriptional regulator [Clostridia bacterium]|nr:AraC family transcriptional regulator [Clostridia bacterium]